VDLVADLGLMQQQQDQVYSVFPGESCDRVLTNNIILNVGGQQNSMVTRRNHFSKFTIL